MSGAKKKYEPPPRVEGPPFPAWALELRVGDPFITRGSTVYFKDRARGWFGDIWLVYTRAKAAPPGEEEKCGMRPVDRCFPVPEEADPIEFTRELL